MTFSLRQGCRERKPGRRLPVRQGNRRGDGANGTPRMNLSADDRVGAYNRTLGDL